MFAALDPNSTQRSYHYLLGNNIEMLHAIAKALLERETISGADIDLLMNGQELPPVELKADTPAADVPSGAAKPEESPKEPVVSSGEGSPESGGESSAATGEGKNS